MRLLVRSILPALLLGACAPKAIVVEEAELPKEATESGEATAAADEPAPAPPAFGADDGMLGPRIDRLPSETEMRPTVNTADNASLIARPPGGDKPTSE